jgi:parvulin-like peptidyl-prolyl isomerase
MKRVLLVSAVLVGLGGCQSDEPVPEVLARVGESTITLDQYQVELERRAPMRPGYYERAEKREELLQFMIDRQVQLDAARRAGIPDEPDFRDLYERMLIQRLREKRLEEALASLSISDADILQYYEEQIDQFSRPERRQMALIRIDKPARTDEETDLALFARAEEAREAALALDEDTPHFGSIAVEYSNDRGSRYQGGVVGWLVQSDQARYRLPEPVLEASFALTGPGEISPVIETGEALWLLRLVEIDPARQQPLDQVREGIRHRLTRAAAERLESDLIDTLRAETEITINEPLLDTVPIPPSIPPERDAEPENRRPPPLPGVTDDGNASGPAEN